jgi:carbonic anhydrase
MMAAMPDASTSAEYARILADNARYAAEFRHHELQPPPTRRLAVLACMDARLTVEAALGLGTGEAHILRNAGGIATDDVIRSLVISQSLLGTEEVVVIGHTGCGMLRFGEDEVRRRLIEGTGVEADLDFHAFTDLEDNVREQVRRIHAHPWTKDVPVHGLIYEVETGRIRDVLRRVARG